MNVPAELLMPNGHPWSSSSVDLYAECPLAWDVRYGHRRPRDGDRVPDDYSAMDVGRRRGRVLHAALASALEHANIELRRERRSIPGTLRRYYGPARKALGQAWQDEEMPSDPAEAARVVTMFEAALDAVAIPAPGELHGIEQRYEHVTRAGVPVVFIPDVTRWVTPGQVLKVSDWKSSRVVEQDVPRHQQLLRYAGWLLQMHPQIEAAEIELWALRDARGYSVPADPERIRRAVERFDRIALEAMTEPSGKRCGSCRTCQAVRAEAA